MKLRFPIVSLLCALLAAPMLSAQEGKAPQSALGEQMDKIGGAYRKLGALVKDPTKNADALAQVAIIKDATAAALKLQPALTKEKPEADQAKFVADYQEKMKAFIATVGKLETALKAGDNAAATAALDEMKTEQTDDHKQFRKQKQKKKEN
jgi:soluble cytochrome b562